MRQVIFYLLGAAALYATPQLRLSTSTVGPLNIAVGQNGVTQTVSTTNIGDGTLVLSASANVPWITANIAGSNVQIALSTSTLAQGIATGLVTVKAANAIDSPQTIAVTVQMGGGVPNAINFYMPPGGAASTDVYRVEHVERERIATGGNDAGDSGAGRREFCDDGDLSGDGDVAGDDRARDRV